MIDKIFSVDSSVSISTKSLSLLSDSPEILQPTASSPSDNLLYNILHKRLSHISSVVFRLENLLIFPSPVPVATKAPLMPLLQFGVSLLC